MSFDDFLNQAWDDHATQSSQVAARLIKNFALIEKSEQVAPMAALAVHVFGEHLGQWQEGIAALQKLRRLPSCEKNSEADQAIARSIASLEISADGSKTLEGFSLSDQIRILAVSASALSEQKNPERAQNLFKQALNLADKGLAKDDPANRAIAVAGNNLAATLEQKSRTKSETELMILAAETGRKFWEIAGTWLQVERAEYRLAKIYLQAGDLQQALKHAQTCIELSQTNNALPLEFFFGYEVLALVERARGNTAGVNAAIEQVQTYFAKMIPENQKLFRPALEKLLQSV